MSGPDIPPPRGGRPYDFAFRLSSRGAHAARKKVTADWEGGRWRRVGPKRVVAERSGVDHQGHNLDY